MTLGPSYRFSTPSQWALALSAAIPEELSLDQVQGVDGPLIPIGAGTMAAGPDGRIVWVSPLGALSSDDCEGPQLGATHRLVVGERTAWALTDTAIVEMRSETLEVLRVIELGGVRDIAPDQDGGLWLLTSDGLSRMGADGRIAARPGRARIHGDQLGACGPVVAILDLAAARVTLAEGMDGASADVHVGRIGGQDFTAHTISGGSQGFLLTGLWPDGRPAFALLDRVGDTRTYGDYGPGNPPPLLGGDDLHLLVSEPGGWRVRRFRGAAVGGGVRWLTPSLLSDTLAGSWLRAELTARLPQGASLEMRCAATSDEGLKATVDALLASGRQRPGETFHAVDAVLAPLWSAPVLYSGEAGGPSPALESFALPLHAAAGHVLWVELRIHADPGGPAELGSLTIHHDAPRLIDNLPAVFRGPSGDQDGTLRRLLGVLEATTQSIDDRIARLADRLDPDRTQEIWLPDLARQLGLPFDDALPPGSQRRLLKAAAAILAGRGTIAGVRALLEAIFGPRPFTVLDRTEQLAPITLGGGLGGSRLPGFLSGPSVRSPRLNARLVLGRTVLRQTNACDEQQVSRPTELLVIVPATARERRRYAAAAPRMIEAMIPAGVRLRLRWTELPALAAEGSDDVLTVVADHQPLRLGSGQRLGAGRLGSAGWMRIPAEGSAAQRRLQ